MIPYSPILSFIAPKSALLLKLQIFTNTVNIFTSAEENAMNLTSKSRYALKILMDLAEQEGPKPVQRFGISERQDIPSEYMDQIFIRLRQAGLVKSTLGRSGGYRLTKDPKEISVWELFEAAEGSLSPVRCLTDQSLCTLHLDCGSKEAWNKIHQILKHSLSELRLHDLLSGNEVPPNYADRDSKELHG